MKFLEQLPRGVRNTIVAIVVIAFLAIAIYATIGVFGVGWN